jgi:hypothetical protein
MLFVLSKKGTTNMIKWIQQPEGSSLCGQTCVAMIAGITLEESIGAFGGKKRGTRIRM